MDMVTVKRNGVFISFPEFERKTGEVRDDVISGSRVSVGISPSKRRTVAHINVNVETMSQRQKSVMKSIIERKVNIGKYCMRCGASCWRSDVNYCWDCYKYERFESK